MRFPLVRGWSSATRALPTRFRVGVVGLVRFQLGFGVGVVRLVRFPLGLGVGIVGLVRFPLGLGIGVVRLVRFPLGFRVGVVRRLALPLELGVGVMRFVRGLVRGRRFEQRVGRGHPVYLLLACGDRGVSLTIAARRTRPNVGMLLKVRPRRAMRAERPRGCHGNERASRIDRDARGSRWTLRPASASAPWPLLAGPASRCRTGRRASRPAASRCGLMDTSSG